MEENNGYDYKGKRPTPPICQQLILRLLTGKTVKRSDIIRKVLAFHIEMGGLKPEVNFTHTVKQVLKNLEIEGFVTKDIDQKGYYIIHGDGQPREEYEVDSEEEILEKVEDKAADYEFGEGDDNLYVYYLPSYKELADLKDLKLGDVKLVLPMILMIEYNNREELVIQNSFTSQSDFALT